MYNANKPDASELPSNKQLLKSTGIAAAIAGAVLVFTVLPAEYGVDPTGVGSMLGLTEMGRIKMQLAEEAAADTAADAQLTTPPPVEASPQPGAATEPAEQGAVSPATPPAAPQSAAPAQQPGVAAAQDEVVITLAPDAGYEVKLVMEKGAKAKFEWFTNGPGVNYDTHGDGSGVNYHGYEKGTNTERQTGELVAAFTGSHGWFWRNRSGQSVTITLKTSGDYSDVKQYD